MNAQSFGEFLQLKRIEKGITMRKKAELLNVSAPYLSDIEKSRRNPSEMDKLEQISSIPRLNEQERAFMFDLAGKMRNTVAPDLPNYITLKLVMRQRVDNYPHYAYLPMLDLFLPPGVNCIKSW